MKNFNIFDNIRHVSFDDYGIDVIRRMLIDEVHLSSEILGTLNWNAIHADNSGELDTENMVLCDFCNETKSNSFISCSAKDILNKNQSDRIGVVFLEDITLENISALQNGLASTNLPQLENSKKISYEISFDSSVSFTYPLNFILLRERDGYGWSTIAGPEYLIDRVRKISNHGLYEWFDGVLPIHIAGGRDPSKR